MLTSRFILTTRYSKTPDFCKAWLNTNRIAIVITAGLEKPETPSLGLSCPVINNKLKTIKATTSIGNNSLTNKINANRITNKTINISTVMIC